ncbi:hypothetical protein [Croceicoccus marinus]|uniref:hypothetical protein n=1 Tax=Croceicoccus marinus TaxID=450378 RepID=UPI000A6FF4D1|nr:hypothetical protein [Croceicoccus marinus]
MAVRQGPAVSFCAHVPKAVVPVTTDCGHKVSCYARRDLRGRLAIKVLVYFAARAAGAVFVLSAIMFIPWLALAWWSIKLRLYLCCDLEPDLLTYFLTIFAPYALALSVLLGIWRFLSAKDAELNGADYWRR